MGEAFITTSYKGGVGKSTIAVNIAAGIACKDKKVVIVDLDSSVRCVELILGCEDRVVYNYYDFLLNSQALELEKILNKVQLNLAKNKKKTLFFISSPSNLIQQEADLIKFKEFIDKLKENFDYVVFDCPPGEFFYLETLCKEIDFALVISDHSSTSLRAAQRTFDYLTLNNVLDVKLIINCFSTNGVVNGVNLGIVDIIENVKIKLLGIVEFNNQIKINQERGITVYETDETVLIKQFDDIVFRIFGKKINLNKKYSGVNIKKLYYTKKRLQKMKKR